MKEFEPVKKIILENLSYLSEDDRKIIADRLAHTEKLLQQRNNIAVENQCAAIVGAVATLMANEQNMQILLACGCYCLTWWSQIFSRIGNSFELNRITTMFTGPLKERILNKNLTRTQVCTVITEIDKWIANDNHKLNSNLAGIGGAIGLYTGFAISNTPFVAQFGLFARSLMLVAGSTLGLSTGGEITGIVDGVVRAQQKASQLDIRFMLMQIHQMMTSELDGFDKLYSEQNGDANKYRFITLCQNLVQNGWDKSFQRKITNDDYFFQMTLKQFFDAPLDRAFSSLKNNSIDPTPVIKFFARLQLFRRLYEAYKKDNLVLDKNWLLTIKTDLDNEFKKITNQIPIQYNGRVLKTPDDFQQAIAEANQTVANYRQYVVPVLLFMTAAFYFYKYFVKESLSSEARFAIALLTIGAAMYMKSLQNNANAARRFIGQNVAAQRVQQNIADANTQIANFFQVTDAELRELTGPAHTM